MTGLAINLDAVRQALNQTFSISQAASHLRIHRVSLSRKLHGVIPLTLDDLNQIAAFTGHSTKEFLVEIPLPRIGRRGGQGANDTA